MTISDNIAAGTLILCLRITCLLVTCSLLAATKCERQSKSVVAATGFTAEDKHFIN